MNQITALPSTIHSYPGKIFCSGLWVTYLHIYCAMLWSDVMLVVTPGGGKLGRNKDRILGTSALHRGLMR